MKADIFFVVALLANAALIAAQNGKSPSIALHSSVPSASAFPNKPNFQPQRLPTAQEAGAKGADNKPRKTPAPASVAPSPASSAKAIEKIDLPASPAPSANGTADTNTTAETNGTNETADVGGLIAATTGPSNAEGGSVCFPADATVVLESGEVVAMEKLQIGDRVQVGVNQFSNVVMFTHALPNIKHSFVQLTTVTGKTVRATEGHYIYADSKLTRMGDVALGNLLHTVSGNEKVVSIARQTARGLFNPQTAHGDIVVDGIRASTYTETIPKKAAHAMLAPVRAAFEWTGMRINALEKIVW